VKPSTNKASAAYTSAPIAAGEPATFRPEFIRLPRVGMADPTTGLRRSLLNSIILPTPENDHKPPVRSIVLRKPGCKRGVRLIHLASLLDYLNRQAEGSGAA
jgi:hypothetical protein